MNDNDLFPELQGVATDQKTGRHELDFYKTHKGMTRRVLPYLEPLIKPTDRILEPCVGDGAIRDVLQEWLQAKRFAAATVVTNDIDTRREANFHFDATTDLLYRASGRYDLAITNPPFNVAAAILRAVWPHVETGVAFLLRITWLEPVREREALLDDLPLTGFYPFSQPRPSFRLNKDGKKSTDSATTAWVVWDKVRRPLNASFLDEEVARIAFFTNGSRPWK